MSKAPAQWRSIAQHCPGEKPCHRDFDKSSGPVKARRFSGLGSPLLDSTAMTAPRVRLGELLVEAQIVTREQLEEALNLQKQDGRRLGTLLVATGMVTETQVTQILSQQLSVPWVSLYHIDFSRQLLNLVPRELAERHSLVPIFVRRVRGSGETLYLAMDNPEDESAREEVRRYAGLPVRAMIAPLSDIRGAIRAYYGGSDAEPTAPARAAAPPTSSSGSP